jgi:integral membrane protein (TIGR01906 family)
MTGKRVIVFLTSTVFVLMMILLLLFTDVQLTAFNRGYYNQQYEKYQIAEGIGMSMPDLMKSTDNLLNYMDGKREDLDFQMTIYDKQQEFFSERDKQHMIDVKNLVVQGKQIRNFAFWYCLLYTAFFIYKGKYKQRSFSKLMIYTAVTGIILILILAVLMSVDFYKYFTIFHEIFFNNDLWQLDPGKDRLINMYPEAFFSDIAFRIVFYYIGELMLLLALGLFGLKSKKRAIYIKQ